MSKINIKSPGSDPASMSQTDLSKSTYNAPNKPIETPRGVAKDKKNEGKRSLFNSFHIYNNPENIYTDEDFASKKSDIVNPTIEDILALQSGANRYDFSDFILVDKFGKLPLNRMITVRRFAYPCFDDIYSPFQKEPDISRLITYFDQETNALESMFNMTFGMKWKMLESESEQGSMVGDESGASGIQKQMLAAIDPQYGERALAGKELVDGYDPQHDANKVYGPVDSIASTHIRDVGLVFEQPIELTFDFKLRSIDGMNPKAMFLDLLGNILSTTTNDAKFWGGARYWQGAQQSSYAKDLRKLGNAEYINKMNSNGADLKTNVSNLAKELFSADNIENVANNLGNLAMGKLLDKLGRPSIPVFNSLLTGEPVGNWHISIGNPMRPIMSMGNMILESSVISVPDGALGNDDFPTALRLTMTLKHAMPRGRAEIESMFSTGKGRTYWKPDEDTKKQILTGNEAPNSLKNITKSAIGDVVKNLYGFAGTQA